MFWVFSSCKNFQDRYRNIRKIYEMKQKGKKLQNGALLGFEPRTLGTITARPTRSAISRSS